MSCVRFATCQTTRCTARPTMVAERHLQPFACNQVPDDGQSLYLSVVCVCTRSNCSTKMGFSWGRPAQDIVSRSMVRLRRAKRPTRRSCCGMTCHPRHKILLFHVRCSLERGEKERSAASHDQPGKHRSLPGHPLLLMPALLLLLETGGRIRERERVCVCECVRESETMGKHNRMV
jgi:hypothetical protein